MILKEEKYLKTLFQSSLMFPACTVFIRSELFVWCNIRVAAAAAAACWIIHCVLRKVACLLILKSKWELMEWQAAELKEQSSRISVPQVCVCMCVCVSEGRNDSNLRLAVPPLSIPYTDVGCCRSLCTNIPLWPSYRFTSEPNLFLTLFPPFCLRHFPVVFAFAQSA